MQYITAALAFIFFFTSCSTKSTNLEVFKTLNEGLIESSQAISVSNMHIYKILDNRLRDVSYSNADIWHPKAIQIKFISDNISQYIDQIKSELKNDAGISEHNTGELYKDGGFAIVNRFFDQKGKQLYDSLISYRKAILSVDTLLEKEFKNSTMLFSKEFGLIKNDSEEFVRLFFKNIPIIGAIAILNKFQNDVEINESNFNQFCMSKTYSWGWTSETPHGFINLNSNSVKPGGDIQITAGFGYFTSMYQPKFIIDGKEFVINNEGLIEYKFKTEFKPGNYSKRVQIEYILPDGTKASQYKDVEYSVME